MMKHHRTFFAGVLVAAVLGPLGAAVAFAAPAGASGTCTTVTTSKGTFTAAVATPAGTVSGTVTPAGCDIGVYFGPGTSGTVTGATISGFTQYGVFNDGGTVTVENSTISDIGDSPFDGAQHGIGVYFVNPQAVHSNLTSSPATGTISDNTISAYQKGGVTVNGTGSSASVMTNTVTGLGRVTFIAQNGIQFGFGATGSARGNDVSDNYYTGCSNQDAAKTGCIPYVSTGVLLYDVSPSAIQLSKNHYRDNQRNHLVLTSASLGA